MGFNLEKVKESPFWKYLHEVAPNDASIDMIVDSLEKASQAGTNPFFDERGWENLDSFLWSETPQGHNFWRELTHKTMPEWNARFRDGR